MLAKAFYWRVGFPGWLLGNACETHAPEFKGFKVLVLVSHIWRYRADLWSSPPTLNPTLGCEKGCNGSMTYLHCRTQDVNVCMSPSSRSQTFPKPVNPKPFQFFFSSSSARVCPVFKGPWWTSRSNELDLSSVRAAAQRPGRLQSPR